MSTPYLDQLDLETKDVINYLKSRSEISDIRIEEIVAATSSLISDWEVRNLCNLPHDLKSFYMVNNGLHIEWKIKLDLDTNFVLGKMHVNGIGDLTRVGSVLSKDFREPSVFDLEELQTLNSKNRDVILKNIAATNSCSKSSNKSGEDKFNMENYLAATAHLPTSEAADDGSNRETVFPGFDESSRNFELDTCNGYGKVCLVYRSAKAGIQCSEHTAEIWYLDRSLQWHYMTNSFRNYYRLLIAHLGLPQWQMLFTDDGLPPFLYQWYYLFTPGRIIIHEDTWQTQQQFLEMIENKKPSQTNPEKKIDFAKLFDEKQSKAKSTAAPSQAPASKPVDKNAPKPKPRPVNKK